MNFLEIEEKESPSKSDFAILKRVEKSTNFKKLENEKKQLGKNIVLIGIVNRFVIPTKEESHTERNKHERNVIKLKENRRYFVIPTKEESHTESNKHERNVIKLRKNRRYFVIPTKEEAHTERNKHEQVLRLLRLFAIALVRFLRLVKRVIFYLPTPILTRAIAKRRSKSNIVNLQSKIA